MTRRSDDMGAVALDGCAVRTVDTAKVVSVRAAMPAETEVSKVAAVFGLLGDANRLRLLIALLEGGEMCVCDMAATAGMSESAASHAVRLLRAHRIVSAPRRQGRMAYYRLEDGHVRMLLDVALAHSLHATVEAPAVAQTVHVATPIRRGATLPAARKPRGGTRA